MTDKTPRHIFTVGNPEQIGELFKGDGKFLKGQHEPRVAMVGRSNVGKSSLINSLVGRSLAQVSKEPGKTRLIHFYLWPDSTRIIADLPGYGYARASQEDRNRWNGFIQAYLRADLGLERALVLLDSRHGPTDLDVQAIKFILGEGIPVTVVFTKIDELRTQKDRAARKKETRIALKELGLNADEAIWVSSKEKLGLDPLRREIARAFTEVGAAPELESGPKSE